MGKKRYLLIFWSNIGFAFMIIFFTVTILLKKENVPCMDLSKYASTNPRYKSINVICNNKEYHILSDEVYLDFVINRNRDSNNKITYFSSRDIIIVDSITLSQLREYIVVPQPKIDSIYKRMGVKYILDTFFVDDTPKAYIVCDTLSANQVAEINYVMDILIRQGVTFFRDCETGFPMLSSSKLSQ